MRWLHSPAFDIGWISAPAFVSVAAVLLFDSLRTPQTPLWAWLIFVVFIDVAHVYATLYRVYFDQEELARRPSLYLGVPCICLAVGILLYRLSSDIFWRTLAYTAVFHFVRQQYGFMRLYQRLEGETPKLDRWLDAVTVYAAMLYPLVFWHGSRDRLFAWFVEGDFVALPSLPGAVRWLYAALLAAYAARQLQKARAGAPVHPGKAAVVLSTAAAWYVGIVHLNSDLAFAVTNVVAHGVPYLAFTWLYGRRRYRKGWLAAVHRPALVALFLLPLLALAYGEEALWDAWVWREHADVFFGLELPRPQWALGLLVPLLALPQATHYILDAWVWRMDGSNPGLKELLLESRRA